MIKKPATAKLVTIVAVLAVATAAAAALATKYHSASKVAAPAAAPPPPVSVVAASVQSHDVPIYLRGVGTVIAYNNVLRAQPDYRAAGQDQLPPRSASEEGRSCSR